MVAASQYTKTLIADCCAQIKAKQMISQEQFNQKMDEMDAARLRNPIHRIEWRLAASLQANSYNPNVVHTPEMKLLERSILSIGWCQPILITADGTIIDGFHRASLARNSPAMLEAYSGRVPCAILDVSAPQAMIMTIRMNRAKGSHVAVRMSEIVHALVNTHGMAPAAVAEELGATLAEVDLLLQDGVFKARNIAEHVYSKAWYPIETRTRSP